MYVGEAWAPTKSDERRLILFERKILRSMVPKEMRKRIHMNEEQI